MCEMVEYASMRLKFVCAMATTLPSAMESTARTTSMSCQSVTMPESPSPRMRRMKPKAASFGAEPMNIVIGVAAP